MDMVVVLPASSVGRDFIAAPFLPKGKDEFYLRNEQVGLPPDTWRRLRATEIEELVNNGNTCDDWDRMLVSEVFDPSLIRNSEFFGLVRIGKLRNLVLQHHDMRIPAGITNSRIISCDIGEDTAIHDVRYLAHYILGSRCILLNIDEMHTTDHAKFGNGIIKEGEPENVRVWLEVMNETGSRAVAPFDGMIPADAYLWAKYRDDERLQKRLLEITQESFDARRGLYGTVGDQCVIKSCRIVKDTKIGSHCYIKGANKLKNITVNSSSDEPSQIGEGVELVNGIMGYGCHVFYGCKAIRFVMGNNSHLKYGARLLNSFLGDNSTVSCCEILNNLIFPAHEQHHNNSFLIASVVLGQSNLAAGATIGSNHNSRANDNEIQAGRGFWPALCTSVKHSCRFASFTLLSKADYPAEMDIPLPFSLVSNSTARDRLEIMPAFWWLYNMYALARNSWKFQTRDQRISKVQNIEFDSLAPDTVEEIFAARRLLEIWTAKALLRSESRPAVTGTEELAEMGRSLLLEPGNRFASLEVTGENLEKSKRTALIVRPAEGYRAYGQMLHYYAVKNLVAFLSANPAITASALHDQLDGPRETAWVNLGGQLVAQHDLDKLREDIGSGVLASWDDIHRRYHEMWQAYPLAKLRHSYATLCALLKVDSLTSAHWQEALDTAVSIQEHIRDQVFESRRKDHENPFRRATYRHEKEMIAAIGTADENSFVKQIRKETDAFGIMIQDIRKRL